MLKIPLLRPKLPDAQALLPFLQQIDFNQFYTNFGPLHKEFLTKLLELQAAKEKTSLFGSLTSSATLGIELALAALDLPAGSKVGVPALTFIATGTAIERCGHIPVVLDVDPNSWLLTTQQMPTGRDLSDIRAVIPVSTFGMPQDAQAWSAWSRVHQIPVIIDAASAWGAQLTAPDVTVVFSLHATKALSSGEGGLILTRNSELAARLRMMSNFGIGMDTAYISTNAKMSEYHAAIGLAHLNMWPDQVLARSSLMQKYRRAFSGIVGRVLEFQKDTGLFSPSLMCVRLVSRELRDELEAACSQSSIQTRRWYLPLLPQQPMLKSTLVPWPIPHALSIADTLLGLPFFVDMTDEQFAHIAKLVLNLKELN